jgi:hypothetical protein
METSRPRCCRDRRERITSWRSPVCGKSARGTLNLRKVVTRDGAARPPFAVPSRLARPPRAKAGAPLTPAPLPPDAPPLRTPSPHRQPTESRVCGRCAAPHEPGMSAPTANTPLGTCDPPVAAETFVVRCLPIRLPRRRLSASSAELESRVEALDASNLARPFASACGRCRQARRPRLPAPSSRR